MSAPPSLKEWVRVGGTPDCFALAAQFRIWPQGRHRSVGLSQRPTLKPSEQSQPL